ncbi:hypothetical protein L798_00461 [Zootermopsis nevadensis]|uniref:Uncharacterized protein n=1 Tax=Zootermopsis nevadensis TaxID=136037 RepID=A0A067RMR8_ZOONE|nr:hypothetical protein L798_00461 [Zootermopsis nevadensis]
MRESTQLLSCFNLLEPVRLLAFNTRNARMSFSQAQRLFVIEHRLAFHPYLTAKMSFGMNFHILLCQKNRQYFISVTNDLFAGFIIREKKSKCMHLNRCGRL